MDGADHRPFASDLVEAAQEELMMESDDITEQVWAAIDAFIPGAASLTGGSSEHACEAVDAAVTG